MTRENNVVYFFRQVKGCAQMTKEILRQRTDDYQQWVQRFATNHWIKADSTREHQPNPNAN